MRILRVVSDLYPFVPGGVGIHADQMSRGQASRGHDVTVLTQSPDRRLYREERTNYSIIGIPACFSLCGNSFALRFITEIYRRGKHADIIHAHSHLFFSTNICVLNRLISMVPLIITDQGLVSASAPGWLNTLYKNTISRLSFHIADRIIFYTEFEKAEIVALGIDVGKIAVIHNGIDTSLFCPDRSEAPEIRQDILWVGRFVAGKDVNTLIEAFSLLRNDLPDTRLTLVGSGPQKQEVEALIRHLNLLSSVTFVDFVENSELPRIYNRSALFVLPSLMEGVPRTLLEAMACGIPVICTDLPHLVSIVGNAGICVPAKNPHRLAAVIRSVLEDRLLADSMGRAGRDLAVKGYSWDDTVEKTLMLYESLVRNITERSRF